jgi:hypothetical protein
MQQSQDLYLSLCAEIPSMIIHNDWELDISLSDDHHISIFVRSDWDIEVSVNDWEWWWVIDMSDYDQIMYTFNKKEIQQLIQDKIDFAYQLCFSM